MTEAYIALGSNLGNSESILREAFSALQEISSAAIVCSSIYRTAPVDCPPGSPDFLNAVCKIFIDGTPEKLLGQLQALEREFGRKPKVVLNEPRPLDLDIIAFGKEVRNSLELTIPHPRAHLRRFVLEPMVEISPDLILPGCDKSISELLIEVRD